MSKVEVSVIILTYNPIWSKLRSTLESIMRQENVELEIVITDDGSKEDYKEEIEKFFAEKRYDKYVYNKNKNNVGIVKNYLGGLKKASGQYVYGISPGDMLYGKNTLRRLTDFCIENRLKICFGNAIYYSHECGNSKVFSGANCPNNPQFYGLNTPYRLMKIIYFGGENILGASYFRERKIAIDIFEEIAKNAIHLEDKCSTSVAIMKKIKVVHFDENVVWYENGSGISTSGNEQWRRKLDEDDLRVLNELRKRYPKDRVLDAKYIKISCKNKFKRRILLLVKHPIISLIDMARRFSKVRYTQASETLQRELENINQVKESCE